MALAAVSLSRYSTLNAKKFFAPCKIASALAPLPSVVVSVSLALPSAAARVTQSMSLPDASVMRPVFESIWKLVTSAAVVTVSYTHLTLPTKA